MAALQQKEEEILKEKRRVQEYLAIINDGDKSNDKDELIESLRNDIATQEKEIRKLRKQLLTSQEMLNASNTKKDELDRAIFQLTEKLNDEELSLDQERRENEELNKHLKDMHVKYMEVQEALKRAKKDNSNITIELEETKNKLRKAQYENDELQSTIAQLQATIDALRKQILDKDATIEYLKTGGSSAGDEVANLRKKCQRYRENCEKAQDDLAKLKLQIKERDSKFHDADNALALLREENGRLKHEVKSLNASFTEYKKQFQNAQKEIERLKLQIINQNQKYAQLEARKEALENELEKYKKENNNFKKQISELKIQLDAGKYDKGKMQSELNVLQKKYQTLQNKLAQGNTITKRRASDTLSLKKISDLESSYQGAVREKENIANEIFKLKQKLAKTENELEEEELKNESLEHDITCKDNRITELENNLQSIKDMHRQDKEQLSQWRKRVSLDELPFSLNHQITVNKKSENVAIFIKHFFHLTIKHCEEF
mgnify:CR=1 FL=1